MRYLSICFGIEATSVAWQPLGWEAVAFAEIEPFPCAVLKHHYPDVPNLGDITQIEGKQFRGTVDLVVAGTPCHDFSIAGKRAGMAGERSGLAREFIRLVHEVNPQWIVWENDATKRKFSLNDLRLMKCKKKSRCSSQPLDCWPPLACAWTYRPQPENNSKFYPIFRLQSENGRKKANTYRLACSPVEV